MMKKLLIPALLIANLSACSSLNSQYQVPVPKDFAKQEQTKLQAAKHWDIVAENVAKQATDKLKEQGLLKLPLHVKQTPANSKFDTQLAQFITTHLVNKGAVINVSQDSTQKLDKMYFENDIQVLKYQSTRSNRRDSSYTPGEYTAAGAGLIILGNAVRHWSADSLTAGLLGAAVALDLNALSERMDDSQLPIPNVEVIIHSSLVKDGQYIMRKSNVYYFNEQDKALYEQLPKNIRVVSQ